MLKILYVLNITVVFNFSELQILFYRLPEYCAVRPKRVGIKKTVLLCILDVRMLVLQMSN